MLKSSLLVSVAIAMAFCCSGNLAAQDDAALQKRAAKLKQLSKQFREKAQADRSAALQVARQKNIPVRHKTRSGAGLELHRIDPAGTPVYYITNNISAADSVSTDEVWPGGAAGLSLEGAGMTLGQWDEGLVYDVHPEFSGRVTQGIDMDCAPFGPPGQSMHATHVAGTAIAEGTGHPLSFYVPAGYDNARGMAPAASLDAYDWNCDAAEMAAAAAGGLLVSNHSYGTAAGFHFFFDPPGYPEECSGYGWWWFGPPEPSAMEDYKFGFYDSDAQAFDQIAFDAPHYLIVKSAGNDRDNVGPVEGGYCVLDGNDEFDHVADIGVEPRNPDCNPFDCLPTFSAAKNILTVGGADDLTGGYNPAAGPSQVIGAYMSGRGPTDDGRIKPDITANAIQLMSPSTPYTISALTFYYLAADGTSAAGPNVSGSLLLLQEHYQDTHGAASMLAATLKALVLHTADESGPAPGPDYEFGWGLLNTRNAAQVITEDGGAHRIVESTLGNGGSETLQIDVNEPDSRIVATLVWTDPPGTPVAPAIDPPDLMLVNDLDLRITSSLPGSPHLPWVLDPSAPADAATRGDNFRDNVEQVVVDAAGPGTYFVEISHKNSLLNGQGQDWSLIVSVLPPLSYSYQTLVDEDFSGGLPAGWSIVNPPEPTPHWIVTDSTGDGTETDNRTGGAGWFAVFIHNYTDFAYAELRTPAMDFSGLTSVNMQFKTELAGEFGEKPSVDFSTDGGASWTTVWGGFAQTLFGPSTQYVDLTPAAGESAVIVRFLFDDNATLTGFYWQVDDVLIEGSGSSTQGNTCGGDYSLPAGQWRLIALPCEPAGSATIETLFGDDLDIADYASRWALYSRDEANDSYVQLGPGDRPIQGEGIFLFSVNAAVLDVSGTATPLVSSPDCPSPDGECFEIPLVKPADASSVRPNMLGHPLPYPVNWANFRLRVAGDPDSPLTPSEAEARNFMSKETYKYSGSAYVPYDDVTPGYDHGALGSFDGFWVRLLGDSFTAGDMTLLVPDIRSGGIITGASAGSESSTLSAAAQDDDRIPPGLAEREAHRQAHRSAGNRNEEWHVRLIAESAAEELRDDGNVLGQLLDSAPGFDPHDLPEPAPFTPYLTVLFPQQDWGEASGDYTSDFHPVSAKHETDEWAFVVASDDPQREVTLSWEGPDLALRDSLVTDLETGAVIEPGKQTSYTFVMDGDRRSFTWTYENRPGKGRKK